MGEEMAMMEEAMALEAEEVHMLVTRHASADGTGDPSRVIR